MKKCPGIDISTGSLGRVPACGVGMGIAKKKDKRDYRVFVVVGDGECQEGEILGGSPTAHKYDWITVVFVDKSTTLNSGRERSDEVVAEH